jgi:hypothetical protein
VQFLSVGLDKIDMMLYSKKRKIKKVYHVINISLVIIMLKEKLLAIHLGQYLLKQLNKVIILA